MVTGNHQVNTTKNSETIGEVMNTLEARLLQRAAFLEEILVINYTILGTYPTILILVEATLRQVTESFHLGASSLPR